MAENKNWFGSLDLAYKYAIVFGSLLGSVLILGLIRVFYDRRKLKQHTKLADEEGRFSKESHRELNMRDKDAGDLFGIRAIEAGYFGGVAQSANNSPALTPRGSVGELSPGFSSRPGSRTAWSASSSALDLNRYERRSSGDNYDSLPSSRRQNYLTMPLSPTVASYSPTGAVRKSPSPTKSPPISPAFSPLAAPAMAHVRQTALRPSTAERTGRHSHSPAIEGPIDFRFEVPPSPLDHPDPRSIPEPPSLNRPGQGFSNDHRRLEMLATVTPASLHHYDKDHEAPRSMLPEFTESTAYLFPDFDQPPMLGRGTVMSRPSTSTRKKNVSRPEPPEFTAVTEIPALRAETMPDASHSRINGFVKDPISHRPSFEATTPITPPLPVKSDTDYFDNFHPLTLTLPVRSPLRLSPASSKVDLNNASQERIEVRGVLKDDHDISPRSSFSYEKTLSDYRRESMIIPPSPGKKYRIGDTPLSSLSPHAISSPSSSKLYPTPAPPTKSSKRKGGVYNHQAYQLFV